MLIRLAQPAELPYLQEIENASGEPFRDIGMPEIADDAPMSLADLAENEVWVAIGAEGVPVAFIAVGDVDGATHVHQVSVHPSHARQGIGAALIEHVTRSGRAVTLTTFRDVPWNAPYYERLGFRAVAEISPGLAEVMREDASRGLDPATRVAMVLLPAQVRA
ncbi:putative N-acetyltransferase YhbS [Lentzea flaviverrucosa]|uniref:Predicted N-acetyltransferase YhbS n=1 Tax=Lentzea flaviverrucosa TaxID=200379 RepID=A0A1H9KF25_9PSEU|nr:putative N-acetyltransferase YhbS [Lentzea flaviverrucosa]SEQ97711.1 Predicted N-acetyltransferase YhbS [Lentzea flaviverrucosa]